MALHPDANAISESIELRWFFSGNVPDPLLRKFKDFAQSKNFRILTDTRADYYLKNKRDTVGIKLRKDGAKKDVELKFLKASTFHDDKKVSGQVERWRKWKFPAAKFNFKNDESILSAEWIVVQKTRHLTIIPGPVEGGPGDEGCGFELTTISSTQGVYWTLGFEAFSASGSEETNFRFAMGATDLGCLDLVLARTNSFSYPKFISTNFLKERVNL
jgi:hypothetical protein